MELENTTIEQIISIKEAQKAYFASGATLDIDFRKSMLRKFLSAMEKWEAKLSEALWEDLHKSYEEAYLTELSIVKAEIRNHICHLAKWARKRKACSPLKLFPSRSYIVKEPLGNALIISPWNYPVQLLLNPLVGAISAGCTAVLKPSPYVPTVSKIIEEMKLLVADYKPCGALTVQLIREETSGEDYYIEINPRFGGGAPLSIKAGADSAAAFLRLLMGEQLAFEANAAEHGAVFSRFDQSVRVK